jgi:hypothetical protein
MNLFLNGDSNMSGAEVPREQSIAWTLADLLGASVCTNWSLTGCSNDRIYDSMIKYLETNPPDMIVIGWTESNRIQWFDNDIGQLLEINAREISSQPYTVQQTTRAAAVRDLMTLNSPYGRYQSIYWHNKIFNLHRMLKYRQIPHLFFSAIDLFQSLEEKYHFDWGPDYYHAYQTSYRTWGIQNHKQEVTPGRFHFVGSAQIEWAHMLFNHIRRTHII